MNFTDYQERARRTDQNPQPTDVDPDPKVPKRHEIIPLLGLVGEIGGLLGEQKKLLRDGIIHRKFREEVAEELGDVLWYVANVATKFQLSLDDIARDNLTKVEDRWHRPGETSPLYDSDLPADQQLPRRFSYRFEERQIEGAPKLIVVDQIDGNDTGDPLTDNAYEDDGYRFHDVMHLAFAARFGWSPVVRKLLRRTGKLVNRTPASLAEVEDGGRAQVIEEAIVAAAYVYASDHAFLDGAEALDWRLLRHIKQMTSQLEVKNRSAWEWNDALLSGIAVWRQLRDNKGGVVSGDLERGEISFTPS